MTKRVWKKPEESKFIHIELSELCTEREGKLLIENSWWEIRGGKALAYKSKCNETGKVFLVPQCNTNEAVTEMCMHIGSEKLFIEKAYIENYVLNTGGVLHTKEPLEVDL